MKIRAVGYRIPGVIGREGGLEDIWIDRPAPQGRDLLVEVRAVSVNPVDTKVRASAVPPAGTHRILGFDAAGVVIECGPDVTSFRVGDPVWYAGSIVRPGTRACCIHRDSGFR